MLSTLINSLLIISTGKKKNNAIKQSKEIRIDF